MSASDRPTGGGLTADDYLAVLQAADAAVDALRQLEDGARDSDARDWAARRRRAAEAELAMLIAASATGRLAGYEAAARALATERAPFEDAPPALKDVAEVAAGKLDRLAEVFRSTLSSELPAPGTVSMELRAAGRAHGSRTFAPVSTLSVRRPLQRAAASSPPEQARAEWTSPSETESRRVEVQQGDRHIEVWVVDAELEAPPLVPITIRDEDTSHALFALLAPVMRPDSRLGYLRVPYEHDHAVVELGDPLRFDDLRPSDAPAILASIAASGRSWRELWLSGAHKVPWLETLAAQALVEHERD